MVFKPREKGNDNDSSSVTSIEVEKPWLSGTNKPIRHQDKTSSGFEGVRPTSSNGTAASAWSVKAHSVDSVSSTTRSTLAPEKSIDSSFSPVSNHLSGSNPTTMVEPDTNTDTMQGDAPYVPRHTRRNAEQNGTTVEISVPPPLQVSRTPTDDVKTKSILKGLDVRGVPEEITTMVFTMKSDGM